MRGNGIQALPSRIGSAVSFTHHAGIGFYLSELWRRGRLHWSLNLELSINSRGLTVVTALSVVTKKYDGYKSFNFNNLQAIRRIRRIRRKYDA